MNARVLFAVSVLSSLAPAVAAGQGTGTRVSAQGAVGTDINAGGDSQSVSILLFTFNRISPYVLASAGHGISRPHVNDIFPDRVTNHATLLFFGGGVRIAVTERLRAFADIRFGMQGERDSIIGLAPVRGGVAWRF